MIANWAKPPDGRADHFGNLQKGFGPVGVGKQVRTLLDGITKILTENPKLESSATPVHFAGVGKDSLDLEMSAFVLTRDGDEFAQIQHGLYLRILDAVVAAGTTVALAPEANVNPPQLNGQSSLQPLRSNGR